MGKIDGRRREAKLMRDVVDDLTAHVGTPSPVQRLMIERAALHLRLILMDEQIEPGGMMPERQAREDVCWHNAYVRTLARLSGLTGAAERPPSLTETVSEVPAKPQARPAAQAPASPQT